MAHTRTPISPRSPLPSPSGLGACLRRGRQRERESFASRNLPKREEGWKVRVEYSRDEGRLKPAERISECEKRGTEERRRS